MNCVSRTTGRAGELFIELMRMPVILAVFSKKTGKTPKGVIETCKARLRDYDNG